MYQKIVVVGRVGKQPEFHELDGGRKVATFKIADNHCFVRNGKRVMETTWFTVSVWGRTAEIAQQMLEIGSIVLVEGRMMADASGNPRQFTTRAGEPASKFEISASNLRVLPSKEAAEMEEMPY
jgi:single-strand DNA-binding protein